MIGMLRDYENLARVRLGMKALERQAARMAPRKYGNRCGARYAHYLGLDLSANANASSLAASAISVSPKRPKRPALM
jgi:hypothetical protein